jgi:hypothetical protein
MIVQICYSMVVYIMMLEADWDHLPVVASSVQSLVCDITAVLHRSACASGLGRHSSRNSPLSDSVTCILLIYSYICQFNWLSCNTTDLVYGCSYTQWQGAAFYWCMKIARQDQEERNDANFLCKPKGLLLLSLIKLWVKRPNAPDHPEFREW